MPITRLLNIGNVGESGGIIYQKLNKEDWAENHRDLIFFIDFIGGEVRCSYQPISTKYKIEDYSLYNPKNDEYYIVCKATGTVEGEK